MNKTDITDAMRRAMHREPALKSPIPAPIRPASASEPVGQAIVPQASAGGLKPSFHGSFALPALGDHSKGVSFTVWGAPASKPRQTQRDKWAKRPCVLRYRAWADKARAAAPSDMLVSPLSITVRAFFPLPKSYRKSIKVALAGTPHRLKPDGDNVLKAVCDALIERDERVAHMAVEKLWEDERGPRVEITVL